MEFEITDLQGGVTVDNEKTGDIKVSYEPERFDGMRMIVRRGKKNFKRIVIE